ncbi:MAG: DUF1330 domain-containing protein [Alphaproteobacteria bacterium]|jgi:uncharacterized protein (DUF1330 family)
MHYLFAHLPDGADAAAVEAALADADAVLLRGAADTVKEGSFADGRAWLAGWREEAAADAAAAALGESLAGVPEAAAGIAALRIEGNGAAPSPDEAAFCIANHTVTDPDGFQPYIAAVADVTAMFGGRFLARAGATRTVAGDLEAGRSVILAFVDRAAAERFYTAPEYAPLLALRLATTRPNFFMAAVS